MAHNQQTLICDDHKELLRIEYASNLKEIQDFAWNHHLCELRCEQFWSAFDIEDNGYPTYKDVLFQSDSDKKYIFNLNENK